MGNKYAMHKQVPTKVTAYVDEGIKELVDAFNAFEHIQTIESCQGNPAYDSEDTINGKALVIMTWATDHRYRGNDKCALDAVANIAKFAQRLAIAIHKYDCAKHRSNISRCSLQMSTYIEISWNGFAMYSVSDNYHYGDMAVCVKCSSIKELTEVVKGMKV